MKSCLFDNRIQLNGSAFYQLYHNGRSQTFGPINPARYAYIVVPSKSQVTGAASTPVSNRVPNPGIRGDSH